MVVGGWGENARKRRHARLGVAVERAHAREGQAEELLLLVVPRHLGHGAVVDEHAVGASGPPVLEENLEDPGEQPQRRAVRVGMPFVERTERRESAEPCGRGGEGAGEAAHPGENQG